MGTNRLSLEVDIETGVQSSEKLYRIRRFRDKSAQKFYLSIAICRQFLFFLVHTIFACLYVPLLDNSALIYARRLKVPTACLAGISYTFVISFAFSLVHIRTRVCWSYILIIIFARADAIAGRDSVTRLADYQRCRLEDLK